MVGIYSDSPRAARHLKRRYGISVEDRAAILRYQKHRCAICGKEEKLHVDHCHSTKVVRGMLCTNCNVAIGKLQEDPELFYRALLYLENPGDWRVYGQ